MKVAIIYYSTYGHVVSMARKVKEGIDSTNIASQVDIFQVRETLDDEVLAKLHAPPKLNYPIATPETMVEYDAFLFGIPTRFGTVPAQWVDFWGSTGGLWASGALYGKPAGMFVSSGSPGSQEGTLKNAISYLVHHGMPYVPLGYANTYAEASNMDEVHGGSAWGSGMYSSSDGSRQASELELKVCFAQGASFAKVANKLVAGAIARKEAAAVASSKEEAASDAGNKKATDDETVEKAKEIPQRAKQAAPQAEEEAKGGCIKCTIM